MQVTILYALLGFGSLCMLTVFFSLGTHIAAQPRRMLFVSFQWWQTWEKTIASKEDTRWDKLLKRAGYLFGWGKAEWVFAQLLSGSAAVLLNLVFVLIRQDENVPFLTLILSSTASFFLPYFLLKAWAGYREELLSTDIARFINRYVNLLENHVPIYNAMVKAARPTRKLKEYVPTLSEWNKDPDEALESFKQKLGIDDAIILVSSMRTIEQLSVSQMATTMQRLEWAVDNRRMFRHRKKIKSLGIGYSIIVYPAFYMGLLVAMFPWYKLLTEILDKYLV
ncbi:hypothetical protein [Brevibacillus sp. H7]|uniref:hypothetical protein n=1 Tax=Brevibacillus sp. H7 TaxID=3349138 RepID=UPI003806C71F